MTTASDPDQIRREIERTQAGLSQDVDALTEKVTPSKIVERRVDSVRDTAVKLKDKVMGGVPQLPDAAGAGQDVVSSVQEATATAAGAVQDVASGAVGTVQEAPQAVRRQARSNPLAAGLIAFGAGWLISSLLPASRREQELADQTKQIAQEKVQPVLQQVAGEVTDNLREPAQQAVESVKWTAQDAGQTVAKHGRAAAQDVAARGQDAADSVRSTSTGTY